MVLLGTAVGATPGMSCTTPSGSQGAVVNASSPFHGADIPTCPCPDIWWHLGAFGGTGEALGLMSARQWGDMQWACILPKSPALAQATVPLVRAESVKLGDKEGIRR